MPLRANFQKSYLWRYALLAAVGLGFSAYFFYDGLIGYPKKLEYATEWEKLAHLDTDQRAEAWRKIVAERGWPKRTPDEKAEEIAASIPGQFFWGVVTALIGLPALYLLIMSRKSWVERTEQGVTTSWGQTMRFADVVELNKSKWAKKGIAKAKYMDQGRPRTFVFDDFKYEREPLGRMLRELEQMLPDDKIIGGPREQTTASSSPASDTAGTEEESVREI